MDGRLRNMASVYIVRGDKMLMLYRIGSRVVPPSWCGIGGHFEPDELNDAGKCVLRELEEETGLTEADITDIKLRYISLRLKNSEVRQNYYFFAGLRESAPAEYICDEGVTEWVPLNRLPELDMPFTAKHVLLHYLEKGKFDASLYGVLVTDNQAIISVLNQSESTSL